MNMLVQNMDMDDTKATTNTKIMQNFLNFSQNDKSAKNPKAQYNPSGGINNYNFTQNPMQQNANNQNINKNGNTIGIANSQAHTSSNNHGGIYSQALGILSKNAPSKKQNSVNKDHHQDVNQKQSNHNNKDDYNTYESRNISKGFSPNIQGINVLSSKVKKKPPTKPNYNGQFNANKNNELNTYSSKQSDDVKMNPKRPSSAPVKGIFPVMIKNFR